jgi:hypothetical protein
MRPIKDAGWTRIKGVPQFKNAPSASTHSFWEWVRKQDVTTQRVAWFLLRIADASEKGDQLDNFEKVGLEFDPDRVWILEKETRILMADFILEPSNFID